MSPGFKKNGPDAFYGWYAVAGGMLVTVINAGIYLYAFGVFLPEMSAEFGWSRGLLSTSVTLGMLCFGLPAPLWGVLVTRFGIRKIIITGNTLAALGLVGMSLIQEPWHCYLFYSFTGLGAGLGGVVPACTLVNNWFVRKRSLALGILTAAGGLGGFIIPPIVTLLIAGVGWRLAWVVLGIMLFAGACLVGGLLLIRNRPEEMGQVPDGLSAEPFTATEAALATPETGEPADGSQMKQVLRQPTIWLIAGFTAAFAMAVGTINTHQVAYLTDAGFSPITAAWTMSLISGMNIVGSLAFGALALRLNIRHLTSACFLLEIIALGILLATRNIGLIYVYSLLFGLSVGAVITAANIFAGAYYRRELYSRVLGTILPFQTVACAAAASIAGGIYDVTGTYTLAFILAIALGLAGFICAFLARPPKTSRPSG